MARTRRGPGSVGSSYSHWWGATVRQASLDIGFIPPNFRCREMEQDGVAPPLVALRGRDCGEATRDRLTDGQPACTLDPTEHFIAFGAG